LRLAPVLLPQLDFQRLSHLCQPSWPALARQGGNVAMINPGVAAKPARRRWRWS
jgi:hypothetical protein